MKNAILSNVPDFIFEGVTKDLYWPIYTGFRTWKKYIDSSLTQLHFSSFDKLVETFLVELWWLTGRTTYKQFQGYNNKWKWNSTSFEELCDGERFCNERILIPFVYWWLARCWHICWVYRISGFWWHPVIPAIIKYRDSGSICYRITLSRELWTCCFWNGGETLCFYHLVSGSHSHSV